MKRTGGFTEPLAKDALEIVSEHVDTVTHREVERACRMLAESDGFGPEQEQILRELAISLSERLLIRRVVWLLEREENGTDEPVPSNSKAHDRANTGATAASVRALFDQEERDSIATGVSTDFVGDTTGEQS